MIISWVIIIILGILFLFIYNSIQSPKQAVKEGEADIEVQLERRSSLIPNLVATVQGYATHEKTLLEEITELRGQAYNLKAANLQQRSQVENALGEKMVTLFANMENYPDLKANQQYLQLQDELTKTEDEIASARRIYNENVSIYNTKVSTFPTLLVAAILRYKPAVFFSAETKDAA